MHQAARDRIPTVFRNAMGFYFVFDTIILSRSDVVRDENYACRSIVHRGTHELFVRAFFHAFVHGDDEMKENGSTRTFSIGASRFEIKTNVKHSTEMTRSFDAKTRDRGGRNMLSC